MDTDSLKRVLSGRVLVRSLSVTVIVGTLLNFINQYEALAGSAAIHWPKLALTYCVPFCVASYGAYSALAMRE